MEGITILNETVISAAPVWLIAIGIIITSISLISAAFCAANENPWAILLAVVCGLSLSFTIMAGSQENHTEYEVLIDESVSFNEFNEKYEVVKQNGKIYTIKEK